MVGALSLNGINDSGPSTYKGSPLPVARFMHSEKCGTLQLLRILASGHLLLKDRYSFFLLTYPEGIAGGFNLIYFELRKTVKIARIDKRQHADRLISVISGAQNKLGTIT